MSATEYAFITELLEGWRTGGPVRFCREVLDFEPTPQQVQIMDAIREPGSRVSASSGHGIGKSTALAASVLWFVTTHYPSKCGCTAPTAHQLKDVLWAEVGRLRQRMPEWFRDQVTIVSDRMFVVGHEDTQFAVARTARPENPEALQGLHSENMLFVIDEASGVADAVFQPVEGALSTRGSRVIMASNPTQTAGFFFLSHHRNKHLWKTFSLSCVDSPLVSPEYVESMRDQYGEDSDIYKVRVLGKFPSASINQLIPYGLATKAAKRKLALHQYQFAPVVLGVDPAWEGDDRSVIYMRQGLASTCLFSRVGVDNMTLAALTGQYWDEYRADGVFIDVGWGAGVIDRLRQLGRFPVPVNFGGKSSEERYSNKRSQMWNNLKKWLDEGGVIEDTNDLIEDLCGPQFGFCSNGKIMLEAKKDMKKRGLRSPDLGDALALTFAESVQKLDEMEAVKGPDAAVAETEYRLF
ncbi:MAG TPA: DEAD/DEAH box helicase family protein [Sedimentisphaerales bacterium]|nr:DEAD/DEAH box helicase family protein [Sedimentisphaerales bacterium]